MGKSRLSFTKGRIPFVKGPGFPFADNGNWRELLNSLTVGKH
jgi:hypothetical protein